MCRCASNNGIFGLLFVLYEGVSKSFRTGGLEPELKMVQLSATRCSCIAILWVSLVSFSAITLCVASQRVFIVVVYFVIDSVRKLLDTPAYCTMWAIRHLLSVLQIKFHRSVAYCFNVMVFLCSFSAQNVLVMFKICGYDGRVRFTLQLTVGQSVARPVRQSVGRSVSQSVSPSWRQAPPGTHDHILMCS
jgi:hypothetical protein